LFYIVAIGLLLAVGSALLSGLIKYMQLSSTINKAITIMDNLSAGNLDSSEIIIVDDAGVHKYFVE